MKRRKTFDFSFINADGKINVNVREVKKFRSEEARNKRFVDVQPGVGGNVGKWKKSI